MLSRDRMTVPSIRRCFAGCVAQERAQGCRVRFDRVASFIHHHPAAASTFETPQLVVYTFNISSTGRCLSSLDAVSGWVVNVCNVALSRSSRTRHSLARRADPAVMDRSQRLFPNTVWPCLAAPQKAAKVMTGSQSVVPEEPHHRAAQDGRMGYRLSPRGHLQ